MMKNYSTVPHRLVKYTALFAVCVVVLCSSDVVGQSADSPKKYTETVTSETNEKISFEMAPIPAGTFLMGSPQDEPGRKDDEAPQHEVRVAPFYLCTTETTIELFMAYYQETVTAKKDFIEPEQAEKEAIDDVDAITGPTPVYGDMTMGYEKNHPAIAMTWHNATTFCKWLSKKTGKKYRLPTEAEWEYACRAGTTNRFGVGNDPGQLKDYAWYEANTEGKNGVVAKKKPNAWGLYDMLGNVREWVYDFYGPAAYEETAKQKPAVNPKGPKAGKVHVARGGDYDSSVEELRCAARAFEEEWWRMGDPQIPKSKWWLPEIDIVGFRVARSIDPNEQHSAK